MLIVWPGWSTERLARLVNGLARQHCLRGDEG
jgi:hypothetical protein